MADRGFNAERLPKSALRYIEKLEAELVHERERLSAGPRDSDTFADPYSDTPRPLGKRTRVAFMPGGRRGSVAAQGFQVHLVDGVHLEVHAPWHLVILPQSSNTLRLRIAEE